MSDAVTFRAPCPCGHGDATWTAHRKEMDANRNDSTRTTVEHDCPKET